MLFATRFGSLLVMVRTEVVGDGRLARHLGLWTSRCLRERSIFFFKFTIRRSVWIASFRDDFMSDCHHTSVRKSARDRLVEWYAFDAIEHARLGGTSSGLLQNQLDRRGVSPHGIVGWRVPKLEQTRTVFSRGCAGCACPKIGLRRTLVSDLRPHESKRACSHL